MLSSNFFFGSLLFFFWLLNQEQLIYLGEIRREWLFSLLFYWTFKGLLNKTIKWQASWISLKYLLAWFFLSLSLFFQFRSTHNTAPPWSRRFPWTFLALKRWIGAYDIPMVVDQHLYDTKTLPSFQHDMHASCHPVGHANNGFGLVNCKDHSCNRQSRRAISKVMKSVLDPIGWQP